MHAGTERARTVSLQDRLLEKAGFPTTKRLLGTMTSYMKTTLSLAVCLFSLVSVSPLLGFACAATWPLGSSRDSIMLDFEDSYSYQGTACVHHGVDIAASAGSAVCAPCSGVLAFVGEVPAAEVDGNASDNSTMLAVSIELADGRRLTLMPFEGVDLAQGEAVAEGQVLGTLAASGDRSSAQPHLHMGLKRDGRYYNPLTLFGATSSSSLSSVDERQGSSASSSPSAATSAQAIAAAPEGAVVEQSEEAGSVSGEEEFGLVTSGSPSYVPAVQEQTEAGWSIADPLAALAQSCAFQLSSLAEGLGELSAKTGIPRLVLALAWVFLSVGIVTALVLHIMHLREERLSSLTGSKKQNALLCEHGGGDSMHKLFPAPGTSFITRGRLAQRR